MQEVDREVRWVAAAFGVEEWNEDLYRSDSRVRVFEGRVGPLSGHWDFWLDDEYLDYVMVTSPSNLCQIYFNVDGSTDVFLFDDRRVAELMARGLYCMGFEDENVSIELNHWLTAHEKLELRLSMPREFWPQRWLDEIPRP